MRNRDKLHQKAKKNPQNQDITTTYKCYRNFCNELLKTTKREYEAEMNKSAKIDSKTLWNTIQKITHTKKNKDGALPLIDNRDPLSSTNHINYFFVNIGKSIASPCDTCNDTSPPKTPYMSHPHSLVLLPTYFKEVESLIINLKTSYAIGRDGVSADFIKRYRQFLIQPITFMCNLAISTGKFPGEWKLAEVHPILKRGDGDCVNNYRPITILPALSKILERIVNSRLNKYLENNYLL